MSTVPGFPNVTNLDDDDLLYLIRGLTNDRDKNIKVSDFIQGLKLLEESSVYEGKGYIDPSISLRRFSDDSVRCIVDWGQLPLQNPVSIAFANFSFLQIQGNGQFLDLDGTFTYTYVQQVANAITFDIIKVGEFPSASWANKIYSLRFSSNQLILS